MVHVFYSFRRCLVSERKHLLSVRAVTSGVQNLLQQSPERHTDVMRWSVPRSSRFNSGEGWVVHRAGDGQWNSADRSVVTFPVAISGRRAMRWFRKPATDSPRLLSLSPLRCGVDTADVTGVSTCYRRSSACADLSPHGRQHRSRIGKLMYRVR